jgi:hypothetical protein
LEPPQKKDRFGTNDVSSSKAILTIRALQTREISAPHWLRTTTPVAADGPISVASHHMTVAI